MYLKSLVLKGFKSFADKSVLSLKPGISCVVGPNGSGKSNISDAVLWVLGERSAKNLRGQAMEDVIFAGSSGRKATGVAEVELVLDNSCGTLPIEYNEVSILRRMYRSGESEYLINGASARRMDVLDILHDSGLGTGTHSIISQGSLDSILQSDPASRRALIEEAAGTLKHKQRKAKTERKLEKMTENVTRARDIVGEVERQLAPLARKAKKARTYAELNDQLSQAKLHVAVDDLRRLQAQWDSERCVREGFEQELQQATAEIEACEAASQAVQDEMRALSEQAASISKDYQAVSSRLEKLDSAATVVRERKRFAMTNAADLELSVASHEVAYKKAQSDMEAAQSTYIEAAAKLDAAKAEVAQLEEAQRAAVAERRGLEDEERALAAKESRAREALSRAERKYEQTREKLADQLMKLQVEEGRKADLEAQLARAQADWSDLDAQAAAAAASLEQITEQEKAAKALVVTCMHVRDEAQRAVDAARETEHSLGVQIKALNDLAAAEKRRGGGAVSWVFDNAGALSGSMSALTSAISADAEHESLVEAMLGADVLCVLADTGADVLGAARGLDEAGAQGGVAFMLRQDAARVGVQVEAGLRQKIDSEGAYFLIDHIKFDEQNAPAVRALLGDIVVCKTLASALELHAACAQQAGLRFVTRAGEIVWPNGKVNYGVAQVDEGQGVLARNRQLQELEAGLTAATEACESARERAQAAQNDLSAAQNSSLTLAEQLASIKGQAQSLSVSAGQAKTRVNNISNNLEAARTNTARHENAASAAKPEIEALEAEIAQLKAELQAGSARKAEVTDALQPIRRQVGALNGKLNEAKLERAKLEERSVYAKRMLDGYQGEAIRHQKSCEDARATIGVKKVAAARLSSVGACIDEIVRLAQARVSSIGQAAQDAQDVSSKSHDKLADVRARATEAHARFDQVTAQLNDSQVKNARLEVQVQNAVLVITQDCKTPIESALDVPALENRPELEAEISQTERKIANLGTVNPDAAEEYEQLKVRYDYLSAQLADLDGARRSLARIDRIIDERMRDDFRNTFDTVNSNFQEIFGVLFPGGTGYLSLTDEADIDMAGIEVHAQPAGKRITKMMLMSGGEKSLVALALLFAVYKTRTTPFYILDEVEAALDDTNLRRLVAYIDKLRQDTQLIMITHQRRTMEMADVLFGVSMQADGVTKVISQRLERALDYAE